MKYFVLFKRQKNQKKHAFSLVSEETLKTIPKKIIKGKKKVGDVEILPKETLKELTLSLGGNWYGDN